MIRKTMTKGKNELKKISGKIKVIITLLAFAYMTMPMSVYANNGYIKPLINLKTVMLTICGSVGAIILIWGIMRFSAAFQKMDQHGEYNAIYTILAGGILLSAAILVGVLQS